MLVYACLLHGKLQIYMGELVSIAYWPHGKLLGVKSKKIEIRRLESKV